MAMGMAVFCDIFLQTDRFWLVQAPCDILISEADDTILCPPNTENYFDFMDILLGHFGNHNLCFAVTPCLLTILGFSSYGIKLACF